MGLRGSAFLALWNDVDPARDEEYERWHTEEHVPERVAVAGFLAGHRYAARERRDLRYFTLYELNRMDALEGAGYRALVERPSARSASLRPAFRNFVRSPCSTLASIGVHGAKALLAVRFESPVDPRPRDLLELLEAEGITGVHLGRVAQAADYPIAAAVRASHTHVLLVEGLDRATLEHAARDVVHALRSGGARHVTHETYALVFSTAAGNLGPHALPKLPGEPHGGKTDARDR